MSEIMQFDREFFFSGDLKLRIKRTAVRGQSGIEDCAFQGIGGKSGFQIDGVFVQSQGFGIQTCPHDVIDRGVFQFGGKLHAIRFSVPLPERCDAGVAAVEYIAAVVETELETFDRFRLLQTVRRVAAGEHDRAGYWMIVVARIALQQKMPAASFKVQTEREVIVLCQSVTESDQHHPGVVGNLLPGVIRDPAGGRILRGGAFARFGGGDGKSGFVAGGDLAERLQLRFVVRQFGLLTVRMFRNHVKRFRSAFGKDSGGPGNVRMAA